MTRTHILKVNNAYMDAIVSGEKNFEVRRDDRGFQKGDTLILCRWGSCDGTGPGFMDERGNVVSSYPLTSDVHRIERTIKFILTGGQFGIDPGYVVMAIE